NQQTTAAGGGVQESFAHNVRFFLWLSGIGDLHLLHFLAALVSPIYVERLGIVVHNFPRGLGFYFHIPKARHHRLFHTMYEWVRPGASVFLSLGGSENEFVAPMFDVDVFYRGHSPG
ncbi:MAG: hypothetical protein ABIS18_05395, partial [Actinomycetota bacterium]